MAAPAGPVALASAVDLVREAENVEEAAALAAQPSAALAALKGAQERRRRTPAHVATTTAPGGAGGRAGGGALAAHRAARAAAPRSYRDLLRVRGRAVVTAAPGAGGARARAKEADAFADITNGHGGEGPSSGVASASPRDGGAACVADSVEASPDGSPDRDTDRAGPATSDDAPRARSAGSARRRAAAVVVTTSGAPGASHGALETAARSCPESIARPAAGVGSAAPSPFDVRAGVADLDDVTPGLVLLKRARARRRRALAATAAEKWMRRAAPGMARARARVFARTRCAARFLRGWRATAARARRNAALSAMAPARLRAAALPHAWARWEAALALKQRRDTLLVRSWARRAYRMARGALSAFEDAAERGRAKALALARADALRAVQLMSRGLGAWWRAIVAARRNAVAERAAAMHWSAQTTRAVVTHWRARAAREVALRQCERVTRERAEHNVRERVLASWRKHVAVEVELRRRDRAREQASSVRVLRTWALATSAGAHARVSACDALLRAVAAGDRALAVESLRGWAELAAMLAGERFDCQRSTLRAWRGAAVRQALEREAQQEETASAFHVQRVRSCVLSALRLHAITSRRERERMRLASRVASHKLLGGATRGWRAVAGFAVEARAEAVEVLGRVARARLSSLAFDVMAVWSARVVVTRRERKARIAAAEQAAASLYSRAFDAWAGALAASRAARTRAEAFSKRVDASRLESGIRAFGERVVRARRSEQLRRRGARFSYTRRLGRAMRGWWATMLRLRVARQDALEAERERTLQLLGDAFEAWAVEGVAACVHERRQELAAGRHARSSTMRRALQSWRVYAARRAVKREAEARVVRAVLLQRLKRTTRAWQAAARAKASLRAEEIARALDVARQLAPSRARSVLLAWVDIAAMLAVGRLQDQIARSHQTTRSIRAVLRVWRPLAARGAIARRGADRMARGRVAVICSRALDAFAEALKARRAKEARVARARIHRAAVLGGCALRWWAEHTRRRAAKAAEIDAALRMHADRVRARALEHIHSVGLRKLSVRRAAACERLAEGTRRQVELAVKYGDRWRKKAVAAIAARGGPRLPSATLVSSAAGSRASVAVDPCPSAPWEPVGHATRVTPRGLNRLARRDGDDARDGTVDAERERGAVLAYSATSALDAIFADIGVTGVRECAARAARRTQERRRPGAPALSDSGATLVTAVPTLTSDQDVRTSDAEGHGSGHIDEDVVGAVVGASADAAESAGVAEVGASSGPLDALAVSFEDPPVPIVSDRAFRADKQEARDVDLARADPPGPVSEHVRPTQEPDATPAQETSLAVSLLAAPADVERVALEVRSLEATLREFKAAKVALRAARAGGDAASVAAAERAKELLLPSARGAIARIHELRAAC